MSPKKLRLFIQTMVAGFLTTTVVSGCSNNPNSEAWNDEQTYFVSFAGDPHGFDPTQCGDAGDAGVADLIYPSYFRYNFLKRSPWELELNLGLIDPIRVPISGIAHTEKGDVPYKGEKWILELRHNLRFQDDACFPGGRGRAITAKDLEYSFKRMADPTVESPWAGDLAEEILGWDEYVESFKEFGKMNYDRPLEGVQLDPVNPYRISVSTTRPYPQLRFLLAMHFTTPIPREAAEKYGDDFAFHPVGCGLFKMGEYVEHDRIVLVRNGNCAGENYPTSATAGTSADLLADFGKPLPFLKCIEFRITAEPLTSYNLFDQGYLDSIGVGQNTAAEVLHSTKPGASTLPRGVRLLQGYCPAVEYLAFNMEDPTFGGYTPEKRRLRQAISLSVDSESYIALLNQGLGLKSEFLLPRGMGGFDPAYRNPYRVYDPKLTRAKELLKEAGYPAGIDPKTGGRLTLYYDNSVDSPLARNREDLIRKQIEALGIKLASRDTDDATFHDKVKHKRVQFFTYGWLADYPDAENFCMLLYGPNAAPNSNHANYRNAEYDTLFERMRAMPDSPRRDSIIHKLRDIAVEDCPWIYVCEDEGPTMYQPWVRNEQSNPILNDVSKYLAIDAPKRVSLQRRWNKPAAAPLLLFAATLFIGSASAARTVSRHRNRRARRPVAGSRR